MLLNFRIDFESDCMPSFQTDICNLSKFNILFGRNGSYKTTILKHLGNNNPSWVYVKDGRKETPLSEMDYVDCMYIDYNDVYHTNQYYGIPIPILLDVFNRYGYIGHLSQYSSKSFNRLIRLFGIVTKLVDNGWKGVLLVDDLFLGLDSWHFKYFYQEFRNILEHSDIQLIATTIEKQVVNAFDFTEEVKILETSKYLDCYFEGITPNNIYILDGIVDKKIREDYRYNGLNNYDYLHWNCGAFLHFCNNFTLKQKMIEQD